MTLKLWFLLIVLSIVWGGSFFFNEIALTELQPIQIVTIRIWLAAIILWLYLFVTRKPIKLSADQIKSMCILAAINNVIPFSLIVWGQTYIESGLASILNATVPLFTVILAHFLTTDEKIVSHKLIGVLIGLFGVIVLIGPSALFGQHNQVIGQLACLAASVSYALTSIYGKRLKSISPILTSASSLTAASIYMMIACWWFAAPLFQSASTEVVLSVIMLGIFSTAIAYILYFRILAEAGATNITLVAFLIPISTIFLGVFFLDESLELNSILGMLLVFLGLLSIDGRLRRQPS